MNEDNSNTSDKMRHSDEDYHEITIDWSNESFDYRKQLFHQLSAYTGIPVEHQMYIEVNNEFNRSGGLQNTEWKDTSYIAVYGWQYDTKEHAMNTFHDGDCFLLKTRILVEDGDNGISCDYVLSHASLVNAAECNRHYCHYLGSRYFTKKFAELMKSNELQTILSQGGGPSLEELHRMQLNLNIANLMNLKCTAVISAYPVLRRFNFDRLYLRYRG
uniref:Uncharacterized protein n=1 Tax=Tetranychus urticae TaxID=32264 RepID=T1KX46_TETUR